MEIFWVVVGVVAVVIYIISQSRTKKSDRTVITHEHIIKTEDGEIKVERTQVFDTKTTEYHGSGNAPNIPVIKFNDREKEIIDHEDDSVKITSRVNSSNLGNRDYIELEAEVVRVPAVTSAQITPAATARKQCSRCKINLPADKFYKSSNNDDGLTKWCITCLDGPKNTKHMKWCPICKIRRKRTSFYPNNQNKDGLMAWCKTCWDKHKAKR